MSPCRYCGKDTGDTNHRLVNVHPTTGSDLRELMERSSKEWICLATGKTYFGSLSEKATEEAQRDYNYLSNIFLLDKLISLDPENAIFFKARGKVYLEKGEFRRAVDDFKAALDFSRDDGEINYLISEAYGKWGKADRADEYRNKSVSKGFSPPQ